MGRHKNSDALGPHKSKHPPETMVRSKIFEYCEALEDDASKNLERDNLTEHEQGYWHAQKTTAKRIRNEAGEAFRIAGEYRGRYGD